MKKLLALSICVATFCPTLALADAQELITAINSGKATVDVRLRSERVSDDAVKNDAHAETIRTVLSYKTADYQGFTGFLQFEDVTNLGEERYNNTIGAKTTYAAIADPALTQVNQAFIEAYGVKLGRQKVVYDNARFIGDVGWRQNDQTFDAVSYTNKVLVPSTTFSLAYLNKINNIVGKVIPVSAPLVNVRYSKVSGDFGVNASAFYYGIEYDTTPADSFQDLGLKVDGSVKDFLYEVSFAQQSAYADGTKANVPDANYHDIQLGYTFGPVTLKAQQEVLEAKFKTPLATLHAFNGWADRFLATPAKGLEDTNIKLLAKYWGMNFVVAAHEFKAETDGTKYGQEIDFSVAKNINKNLSLLVKAAQYSGESSAPTLALKSDVNKTWLQLAYKF
ncbi:hypothetical protein FK216_00975 [Moraxellaceae bacterium AER2_44_116]|nr:hypothetical protein [Moraxellaceae bacterium]TQC99847.1 hypothetical protein FK216_00975 [Moraxellaceae bacterium AER2_44_116]